MTYRILVKPSGFSYDVHDNETVLEAALRCGYFFPHQCTIGVCSTCMGKVLQGKINYAGREVLAITAEEQEKGYALFCCAQPESDLIIEVRDFANMQFPAVSEDIYEVFNTIKIAKDITQLILRPLSGSPLRYQAGQYIKVMHPDGAMSPLSIANAPSEDFLLELHLSHSASNLPAQEILRFIAEEKKLIIKGPYGNCTNSELYTEKPVIFLVRGTGFAPAKAIIEEMKKFNKYPRMHLYWSAASPAEFYMDDLAIRWVSELQQFSYTPLLSRPQPGWEGRVGLLQDVVREDYPDLAGYLVYAGAPEPIVHDVLHELQRAGMPRNQYFSDVFDYNSQG